MLECQAYAIVMHMGRNHGQTKELLIALGL